MSSAAANLRVTMVQALLLGAGLYLVGKYLAGRVGAAAEAVGTAVNPVSDRNLAYRGVNAVGAVVAQDEDFSLGSWLYDITHPGENAAIARERRGAPADERTWLERLKSTIGGG